MINQCRYVDEEGNQCENEAVGSFPCCDNRHGYMYTNWKIVAQNWESCFSASVKGYINQISPRNISVPTFEYYAKEFKA